MACNFSIDFSNGAEEIVRRAQEMITASGGELKGDEKQGTFTLSTGAGSVKGSYSTEGSSLVISIDKKPLWIGCDRIESKVREYLQQKV